VEEKLVPVRSEAELRVGMKAVLKACLTCSRDHDVFFLRREKPHCWVHAPFRCRKLREKSKVDRAISEGRLFRVEDGFDPNEKLDEAPRPKARARIRP
jgi:hypothetical protein